MGHAVLHVTDIEKPLAFYRDLLGFELSDFGHMPVPIHLLHVNGRHHSLAMIASGQKGFHHFRGGRIVDPATWQPVEIFDGPSLWGHDR